MLEPQETQGNVYLYLPSYYKGYRWTVIWREAPRWSPKGSQAQKLLSLWNWGVQHGFVHQPGCSPNPVVHRFLWRLHHTSRINHSLNLQPLSSPQGQGKPASSKLVITAWSAWWPALILKLGCSWQATTLEQKMPRSPRKSLSNFYYSKNSTVFLFCFPIFLNKTINPSSYLL